MESKINLEERKPIWIALSDFYIDNELQDYDFKHIASKIRQSPYTFEEVKRINNEEVFPILFWNLLSVAGVWTGFQEDWLVAEIIKKLQKRTIFGSFVNRMKYLWLKSMFTEYWEKLEAEHKKH